MKFKRVTYIDTIIKQNKDKKHPKPGPGTYNLRKTDKQLKKELKEIKQRKLK